MNNKNVKHKHVLKCLGIIDKQEYILSHGFLTTGRLILNKQTKFTINYSVLAEVKENGISKKNYEF